MVDNSLSSEDMDLWKDFERTWKAYGNARSRLALNAIDLTGVVKHGLMQDIDAALEIARLLKPEQLAPLLSQFLIGASYQNLYYPVYRELVLSMPQAWLKENIERYALQALEEDQSPSYIFSSLVLLCKDIDKDIAIRVCEYGLMHEDERLRQLAVKNLAELKSDS